MRVTGENAQHYDHDKTQCGRKISSRDYFDITGTVLQVSTVSPHGGGTVEVERGFYSGDWAKRGCSGEQTDCWDESRLTN